MDFGVVLQTNPPAARTVQLAKLAEAHGFNHVWTFDSHLLWEEPYVIHSAILAETKRVTVGPFVTNPATRDWTVTASVFATLNEMYGNRTICGIGRGDSAVRVTNGKPVSMSELRESIHVIRELANSRPVEYNGATLQFPWSRGSEAGRVGRRVRAARAQADRRGGRRLHPAAGRPRHRRVDDQDRPAGGRERRPRPRLDRVLRRRADVHRRGLGAHARPVPLVRRDGRQPRRRHRREVRPPRRRERRSGRCADRLHRRTRQGYDYNTHGKADNDHVDFVPDEIIDRFCILGTAEEHIAKLEQLREIGVTQFAGYLQHDNKEETLRVYGETVIPALSEHVTAKT